MFPFRASLPYQISIHPWTVQGTCREIRPASSGTSRGVRHQQREGEIFMARPREKEIAVGKGSVPQHSAARFILVVFAVAIFHLMLHLITILIWSDLSSPS